MLDEDEDTRVDVRTKSKVANTSRIAMTEQCREASIHSHRRVVKVWFFQATTEENIVNEHWQVIKEDRQVCLSGAHCVHLLSLL